MQKTIVDNDLHIIRVNFCSLINTVKPIEVKITPFLEPLIEGKKSELICKTRGSRPAAKIAWFVQNKELKRTR